MNASSTASSGAVSPRPAACRSWSSFGVGEPLRARGRAAPVCSSRSIWRACTPTSIGRLDGRDLERVRLRLVVGEHELRDLVGHRREERVPVLGSAQRAGVDRGAQQDLDVHLVVGAVDTGRVVDRVGVHPSARERVLDTGALREPEVAALRDDLAAQLGRVDAHRVVRAVTDVGVASRCSPSRTCRCRRSRGGRPARAGSPGRRRRASARLDVERRARAAPRRRSATTSRRAGTRRRPPR